MSVCLKPFNPVLNGFRASVDKMRTREHQEIGIVREKREKEAQSLKFQFFHHFIMMQTNGNQPVIS